MISQHYTHTRQVCNTEFPATLNKDGTPRKARKLKRVTKPCEWCGSAMQDLTPHLARIKRTCSRSCASLLKAKEAGKQLRNKVVFCAGCHKQVERAVRSNNDAGKYCSRTCAFAAKSRVSAERTALRRIGDRRRAKERAKERARLREIVAPEIAALRRIARRVNDPAKNITCDHCGEQTRRKRPFFRFCSLGCQRQFRQKANEVYKQTHAYKKARRAAKARRRARIRGAGIADNIDPIVVFENAKWICHICGGKTLKSKRGTTHDRAPELEHIVALANGGAHTWSNVACACRKCNQEKGASDYGQIGLPLAGGGLGSKKRP